MKSQVEALTAAARDVSKQLEQNNDMTQNVISAPSTQAIETVESSSSVEEEMHISPKVSKVAMKKQNGVTDDRPAKVEKQDSSRVKGARPSANADSSPQKKSSKKSKESKGKQTIAKTDSKAKKTVKSRTTKAKVAKPNKGKAALKSSDWTKLSESTLKRKTIKELTGYLEEKVSSSLWFE